MIENDPELRLMKALHVLSPGHQIRTARKDSNTTLSQLAGKAGTTHGRICELEAGEEHSNPTIKTLRGIAKQLGLVVAVEFLAPNEIVPRAEAFTARRRKRAEELLANSSARRILEETQEL